MSKFARKHRFEAAFDGDSVVASLKPLEYGDMLKLQSAAVNEEAGAFMRTAREIIPLYVSDLAGLTDADGASIDIDTLCAQTYFTKLLEQIVGKLMEVSAPPKDPT